MRNLVSIKKVKDILPINGADFIELAKIDGWQCVVKKGEFEINDLGVYFEIDSFLPAEDQRYEFLSKRFSNWNDHYGVRIKTQKLKGCLSQGLLLPLTLFPEIENPIENLDVTETLNILKWEPIIPLSLRGLIKGNFPSFLHKSDQTRIQSLESVLQTEIIGHTFEQSIKLDGTSLTVYYNNGDFGVCSRNLDLKEEESNVYWKVVRNNNLEDAMRCLNINIAIQAEIIGEGLQGNNENIKGQELFVYDIFDINIGQYIGYKDRIQLIELLKNFGASPLNHAPLLGNIHFDESTTVDSILEMADGPSLNGKMREGIVFKRSDGLFSFKAISNAYLLEYDDR